MLQNKNFSMLLSLVMAIMLWVYVIADVNPITRQKIENIEVQILNMETLAQRGLALSEGEKLYIDIVIEGKRADVLNVSASDIIATADVFGYSIGENYIPVTVTVPESVALSEQKAAKIPIKIEELVSVYKDVDVIFEGKLGSSSEATVFSITPEQIEVKGAKSKVASVNSVNAVIDASQFSTRPQMFTAELSAVSEDGQPVSNVKLSSQSVDIEAAVYKIKEVPLDVEIHGEVDKNYEVTEVNVPEKVKIKGLAKDLEKVDSVTASPVDISSVIATTDIPLSVNLPSGVMLAQESRDVSIGIIIKGISVKEFEVESSSITANGLGENLSLVINTQSVMVKASGKETVITQMVPEDIELTIDLTGLAAGVYAVPIVVSSDKGLSELSVTPSEINITINEAV